MQRLMTQYAARFTAKIFVPAGLFLLLSACVPDALYIRKADVEGPAQKYLVRVTENSATEKLTVRAQVSQNMKKDMYITAVENSAGSSQDNAIPPDSLTNNVHWTIPSTDLLLDVEFPLSKAVVLFGGINFSQLPGQSFIGKSLGIGFRTERDDVGVRLDFCYNIQQISYQADYVLQYGDWIWNLQEITFYNDQRTFSSKEVGIGLTLNTVDPSWLLNPFFHAYYGSQALIEPRSTDAVSDPPTYTDKHINLCAGIFLRVADRHRILFGIGFNQHDNARGVSPWIGDVILQFDFVLANSP